MRDLMEIVSMHAKEFPKKAAIIDNGGANYITYGYVEYLSGKVYAYLKARGIGAEDFVAICLPRSAQPIIAFLGVWKAGAAFVILEEHYAPERTRYILKNCGCKITIDSAVWQEIQESEYLAGHEPIEAHQAALAIYTSGSTGNPKGVLHEFGNIDRIFQSMNYQGNYLSQQRDIFAMLSPLTFIAGCGSAMMNMLVGATLHVLPYAVIKNPAALEAYLLEHKVNRISLSPTLFRAFREISPYLEQIILGGEPISGLCSDKVQLLSAYSSSECGAMITCFEIDKPYARTPIGKPQFDIKIWLLDEEGSEVPDGESGELCIDNPYVRGYIGMPELNASAFGENSVYHTGDIAKKLPDGNYMLLGRCTEMIKISGNRVEPAEVEAAVRKALQIDWCVAKGFTEGGKTFICAYYIADIELDYGKTRKRLLELVPYYMVPSHFIRLDEIPLNANGKVDRKALQPPVFEDFREAYAAPGDALEAALCAAFEKVLKLDRIGVNDDFYKLGGDSLGAMTVVVACGIRNISINEIFRGRTPARIAQLCRVTDRHRSSLPCEESEIERERKMRLPHSLTAEQTFMVDYQLYAPKSTMFNLSGMFRFGKDIDAEALENAVNAAIAAHPALSAVFSFNPEGELEQRYAPEKMTGVRIEDVSGEQLEEIQKNLIRPFRIIGSPLYRCRLFRTEEACCLFLDIYHAVCDGTGYNILLRDISDAYGGKLFERKDVYYEWLRARETEKQDEFYLESRRYYEKRYSADDFDLLPTPDVQGSGHALGRLEKHLPISADALDSAAQAFRLSRNGFFIAAGLLAMAAYNKTSKVRCTWIHNGRSSVEDMNTVGLLFRSLPAALEIRPDTKLTDAMQDLRDQIEGALEHSCYPYMMLTANAVVNDTMCMLYQQSMKRITGMCGADIEVVALPSGDAAFQNILDFEVMDAENGFDFLLEYAECRYSAEAMERFADVFCCVAARLAASSGDGGAMLADIVRLR